ncbi:hypothetical protein E6O75_ATG06047 [Venturia nashicola]|uniref:BTB domain-containing protein n=1 Tax=Venturia nashicola TaxID=86259 RepID=A0A4Z1NT33_9PEZI|nr:hypothetical protein E6O75_ATG06047 [Venturia nashicola]
MATSKFPQYRDGDVVISLTSNEDENFILHSDVLAKYSEFFRQGLSSRWLQSKITGTKIIDNRTITMKRYELVEDEECKDLFLLEGKTTSSGMCDRVDAGKGLIAAYTLAFAIMYEDREGRIDVDKLLSDIVLKELHTFMDAYQCYDSRSMRLRLQSLILESPMIGPMGINAESPRFIPIGKGLRSPDIYMHAVRGAALGHYFSQRKNSKHPYLKRDYDENTMEIMKFWAAKIAVQYDPIVDELDKLASTAIAQLQVHHKVSSPMTGESRIFRSAAKWIILHRAELYSLHSFDPAEGTCGTQNWLWYMYSQPHKFAHEPCTGNLVATLQGYVDQRITRRSFING